jgi:transcriptional regulator with XRE-family HTH domain
LSTFAHCINGYCFTRDFQMSRSKKAPPHERDPHYIAQRRKAARKTQSDVAREIGMSQAAISRVEAGKNPYVQDRLEKMARYFSGFSGDCTPAAMLIGPPAAARITIEETDWVADQIVRLYTLREPVRRRYLQELLRVLRGFAAHPFPQDYFEPLGAVLPSGRRAPKKPPTPGSA